MWFLCLNCFCVLFVVDCDVVRFVMCLRVLLCVVFVCAWMCYVFVCFIWHLSCGVVWCDYLWGVVFVVSVVHVDVFVCCVWFLLRDVV